METIICDTCGQEKHEKLFFRRGVKRGAPLCKTCYNRGYDQRPEVKNKRKVYRIGYCRRTEVKDRHNEQQRGYYQNPEVKAKISRRQKLYFQDTEVKAMRSEYRARPDIKSKYDAYGESDRKALRDIYIKKLISKRTEYILRAKDIPLELIETQRQSLALKRILKQKQQQNEQRNSTNI